MTRLEGDSPLDLFDKKIADSTDFSGYLRLLAQEGFEPMLERAATRLTPERRDRSLMTMVSYTAYRVLCNRQEQGLQMILEN